VGAIQGARLDALLLSSSFWAEGDYTQQGRASTRRLRSRPHPPGPCFGFGPPAKKERAKIHIPNRIAAKGVQLRLLRQRVVMAAEKAQADVLLHRLHCALPGWDVAADRRDAQGEFHSAAQARASTAQPMALLSTASAARLIRAGRAASEGWRGCGGGFARALAVYRPPPPKYALTKL
jgi:hypothetical protein